MSKIQDAIRRLQSEGGPVVDRGQELHEGKSTLAKISDSVILDASEVRRRIGQGPILEIDQKALRNAGLIAPDYHEQLLADQYRNIKRPLIANAYGKRVAKVDDGNVIMITSAMPGEGKTFTAMNLAISIAQEQDTSALLIDADVAKPHISDVFGLSEMPGLLDILEGSEDRPEALIVNTDMPGLSILPAGKRRHNATELLSGLRMERLIKDLATRFPQCMAVFDTPPLLHTSESRVITNWAGQIILVVKANATPQASIDEALQVLAQKNVVHLILNQTTAAGSDLHYNYGYGYGQGDNKNK